MAHRGARCVEEAVAARNQLKEGFQPFIARDGTRTQLLVKTFLIVKHFPPDRHICAYNKAGKVGHS